MTTVIILAVMLAAALVVAGALGARYRRARAAESAALEAHALLFRGYLTLIPAEREDFRRRATERLSRVWEPVDAEDVADEARGTGARAAAVSLLGEVDALTEQIEELERRLGRRLGELMHHLAKGMPEEDFESVFAHDRQDEPSGLPVASGGR